MIIVKLKGGLGNQMFQYAYGRAVSAKLKVELKLDANYYFNKEYRQCDLPRNYLLNHFNIKAKLATIEEVNRMNPLWRKALKKFRGKIFGYRNDYLYHQREMNIREGSYLDGYWQTDKYFSHISDEIRSELTLLLPFTEEAQKILDLILITRKSEKRAVSLHVRRSDYVSMKVNSDYFGSCGIDYYERAFKKLNEIYNKNSIEIFIFSDDITWAKNNLSFSCPINFISKPEIADYEELILMSKCSDHIIANSSFSWWGAWLNPDQSKTVIAPERWLMNKDIKTADAVPNEWIRL